MQQYKYIYNQHPHCYPCYFSVLWNNWLLIKQANYHAFGDIKDYLISQTALFITFTRFPWPMLPDQPLNDDLENVIGVMWRSFAKNVQALCR